MTRFSTFLLTLILGAAVALPADAVDFSIRPTARALFDAAAYSPTDGVFTAGVAMPDVRLGALANFGRWEARADVSYRFGKLYPADIYIQYKPTDNSLIKGGYFVHQWGLQSATGASHKISMEQPIAESAFGEPRLLGAMYVWHNPRHHFAGSLYAQGEAATRPANDLGRTGVGVIARYCWHPSTEEGRILQIGIDALGQTPSYSGDKHNPVSTLKVPFPSKVCNVTLAEAQVDKVSSIFKLSPEVLGAWGRWALEGQFYWERADRKEGLRAYDATGLYALGRVLLNRGAAYRYAVEPAALATPTAGSWEIVAGYSHAALNDRHAGITGGRADEATVTLNYYIHKYVTWRVNYAYAVRHAGTPLGPLHTNIIQTRIQFVF